MPIAVHQPFDADRTWRPEDVESAEPVKYEIVDGNLLLLWPVKSLWHQSMVMAMVLALKDAAPEGFKALSSLTVGYFRPAAVWETLREPDVVVLRPGANEGPRSVFGPRDIALVVEVEAPATVAIDRLDKVGEYARAGIACYWRVEQVADDEAVVHVYEVDPQTGEYALIRSIGPRDTFQMRTPFPVFVDPAGWAARLGGAGPRITA